MDVDASMVEADRGWKNEGGKEGKGAKMQAASSSKEGRKWRIERASDGQEGSHSQVAEAHSKHGIEQSRKAGG